MRPELKVHEVISNYVGTRGLVLLPSFRLNYGTMDSIFFQHSFIFRRVVHHRLLLHTQTPQIDHAFDLINLLAHR